MRSKKIQNCENEQHRDTGSPKGCTQKAAKRLDPLNLCRSLTFALHVSRQVGEQEDQLGPTGALCVWVEREVKLLSEESSVICVDQLEHTLMDDVRL